MKHRVQESVILWDRIIFCNKGRAGETRVFTWGGVPHPVSSPPVFCFETGCKDKLLDWLFFLDCRRKNSVFLILALVDIFKHCYLFILASSVAKSFYKIIK